MGDWNANKIERYIKYTLVILGMVLLVLLAFFVVEYQVLRHEQIARHRGSLPVTDASAIRTWMTFDYIGRLFMLPPDYLKTELNIADPHYPRITLANYAASQHVPVATFLNEVEQAVSAYMPPGNIATSTLSA